MSNTLNGIQVIRDTKQKSYEEFRTAALEIAQQNSPEWTDFYPADPGVTLIEIMSGIADVLSYQNDRVRNESLFGTTQIFQTMLEHCKIIGYNPAKASCALCYVNVTVSDAVTLPGINSTTSTPFRIRSQSLSSAQSKEFELVEDTSLVAAGTYNLLFAEGRTIRNEIIGSSNGKAGQIFFLSATPLAYSADSTPYLTLQVFNGSLWETWSYVESFIDSTSTDKVYKVELSPSGKPLIVFGDGTNGAIPSNFQNNIRVTYRIGGGDAANFIPASAIREIASDPTGLVTAVLGTTQPSGGSNADTVQRIREVAPKFFSTQNRIVTHSDFEAAALNVNGVYKAKAKRYFDNPLQEVVYIATNGPNPVPTGVWNPITETGLGTLGAVGRAIAPKKCTSVKLFVEPISPVEIVVNCYLNIRSKFYNKEVINNVRRAIINHVRDSSLTTIPELLPLSNLVNDIEDVEGIRYVDVLEYYRKPVIRPKSVTTADTIFSSVGVGPKVVEELLTIEFIDSTNFIVYGTSTGTQQNTGVVGTNYVTDDGSVAFRFDIGPNAIQNAAGDTYTINTSKIVGNIPIYEGEIPVITSVSLTVTGKGGIE